MSQNRPPLEVLRDFATEAQLRCIDALIEHGSERTAAAALGVHHSLINRAVKAAHKKQIRHAAIDPRGTPGFVAVEVTTQFDGDDQPIGSSVREKPDSLFDDGGIGAGPARDGTGLWKIKGVSTNFDATGQQRQQWVKTTLDHEARASLMMEAFAGFAAELPRFPALPAPALFANELCNLYTMTDCHVGMLAWEKEGGKNWDLKIAEQELIGCFAQMVEGAPAARTCVINQLGDWLHFDGLDAVTPTNRHVLDADARFQKVVDASLRILRTLIDMALLKHQHVYVVMAEGNHDIASSVWLRVMFKALYEDEPRVTINDSALPYYMHRHGKTVLWFHHGHLKRGEGLPALFAAQFPVDWGETTKRYIHIGHVHHEAMKEYPGVKLVQHPTLAARDAHASRHGYISERQATAYTYHVEFGQVGSNTVVPEMLQYAA